MSESAVFNGVTGTLALSIAFAASLVAMFSYLFAARNGSERAMNIGRLGFHVAVVSFMVACAVLMFLILTHQYQYHYVWRYSSNFLAKPFLLASFYTGQQGSFMLWTLLTCMVGVFVLGYAQKVKYEAPVMGVFGLVITCLLLILVVDSPFVSYFEKFPEAIAVPDNGNGLNPTLENIWLTIHPPILFSGFAAMTVPFVFAVGGLIKRDYQRWVTISLPWTLFASMVLGFGIMLGGWWAYETLGWGGFWGWDPVENSSLIPWLVCVSLVHTMLVQKRTGTIGTSTTPQKVGGLVKTNFLLAVLAFGLILYSTFLTRSGVLGDTSVHSFVEPGNFVYAVLLGVIFLFVGIGVVALIWRWRELRQAALEMQLMSRENALAIGSAVLAMSALIVMIGTSYPIFLPLFDKPKIALDPSFYNSLQLPLGIIIVLLNGISMMLKWKNTPTNEFYRKVATAVVIASVGTLGLVLLGVHDIVFILLGFGSVFALVVNVQLGWRILRGNRQFVGAYVSHAGVAFMMLGIVFTARYGVTDHVQLIQGEPKKALGYTVTYMGFRQVDKEKLDRQRLEHKVVFEKDGDRFEVHPITMLSDFNNRESAFMEPGIKYYPTKDVYVAPKGLEEVGGDPSITMRKGDKVPVPFDSSVTVKFEKFDMSRAQSEGMQGAVFEIAAGDSVHYITSYRSIQDKSVMPAGIPGTDVTLQFDDLLADRENLANSQAVVGFRSASHPPGETKVEITLDVSIKPFISFVWVGVVVMVGGFFFSILRRRKDVIAAGFTDLPPAPRGSRDEARAKAPAGIDEPVVARSGLRR